MPKDIKLDEVRPTPIPGLWEVRIGTEIRYTDATGQYLIEGEMLDLKNRRNLTQDRLNKLLQNRATLKLSVETGLDVADKLTTLVRELRKYKVE